MFRIQLSRQRIVEATTGLLFLMFLVYTFVTLSPFSSPDVASRVEGSPVDRIFVLAMGGLALVIVALRFQGALMLVRQSAIVWLLTGWCVASLLWSDFPDLTVRRVILLVLLNLAAFAIALGARNLYRLHVALTVFLALVVLVNVLSAFVVPGLAYSDIGLRGIYSQKNIAGMVGMIAVFATLTWLFGARRPLALVAGAGILMLEFVFLILTQSKTSLGLSVLVGTLVPILALVLAHGARQRWMVGLGSLFLVVVVILLLLASHLSRDEILTLLFGDPTFTRRTDIWEFAWSEILRRPWLGSGYGAFWDVGAANDPVLRAPPGTFLAEVEVGVINQAHNGFLDLWLQVGLPALVMAVMMVFQSIGQAVRLAIAPGIPRRLRAVFCFLLIIMLVYLLSNAMEATLFVRGLLLNNLAMLVIFLIHRVVLERRIAARLRPVPGHPLASLAPSPAGLLPEAGPVRT